MLLVLSLYSPMHSGPWLTPTKPWVPHYFSCVPLTSENSAPLCPKNVHTHAWEPWPSLPPLTIREPDGQLFTPEFCSICQVQESWVGSATLEAPWASPLGAAMPKGAEFPKLLCAQAEVHTRVLARLGQLTSAFLTGSGKCCNSAGSGGSQRLWVSQALVRNGNPPTPPRVLGAGRAPWCPVSLGLTAAPLRDRGCPGPVLQCSHRRERCLPVPCQERTAFSEPEEPKLINTHSRETPR